MGRGACYVVGGYACFARAVGHWRAEYWAYANRLTSSSRSATHLMDVRYSLRCLWLKAESEGPG